MSQGLTKAHVRGPNLKHNFFGQNCARVVHGKIQNAGQSEKHAMAVNRGMAEPDNLLHQPVANLEAAVSFEGEPRNMGCVRDHWY